MDPAQPIELTRDCPAVKIPSGESVTLPKGMPVFLSQSLGGTHTVVAPQLGGLFRISNADADAIGLEAAGDATPDPAAAASPVDDALVWERLRTCYDPEIPVNIVDLGLIYDLRVTPHPRGGSLVTVKMTLTAPGCGMGTVIAADARYKIQSIPGVSAADVQLVWDPPWSAEMMTEAGRRALGIF